MSANFKGDKGFTNLIGENGVSKDDVRIEAIGSVDEAWAALGFARSIVNNPIHKAILLCIQNDLHILMSQLAGTTTAPAGVDLINEAKIDWLEQTNCDLEAEVVMPKTFIVSGDTPAGGALAMARTIVRRAERQVVAMAGQIENFDTILIKYLNRLSAVCFMLELAEYASKDI